MIRLLLILLLISFSAIAGPWENLNQGDQTAHTLLNQVNQKKTEVGGHPFYQGISKEANYGSTDLVGKSQGVASQDAASQMVIKSSDARPQVKIDPQKDPLLVGSQKVLVNPLEVIGGAGTQVIEVRQGGKTETLTCEEGGEDSLETCTRELTVKVIKTKVEREWQGAFQYSKCCNAERRGHYLSCQSLRNSTRGPRKQLFSRKRGAPAVPQDPDAWLNITQPYKACMAEIAARRHGRGCDKGCHTILPTLGFRADQIKAVFLIRNPQNPRMLLMNRSYFHQYKSGRTEYDIHPRIKIIYEEDSYEVLPDEWSENCARLEERVDQGLCGYHSKVCTQGPQTRIIEGIPITRDCWQETMTYHCEYPAKDDCGPLRARGCAQIHSVCKQQVGNVCVVHSQTYQCKDPTHTTYQITGGKTPFCMDGNCRDQSWDPNGEMMSSVAQLSILKEMQGNLKNGFLFTGHQHQCSKYVASFKDCCGSGKGWGNDIGLSSCGANEKLLSKKRKSGLCHYVGTYCAKKVLGKCIKKKSSYCCFGSKLLKAFQEQGRAQIRLGWGEPKHPLCRGFTIEEIQRIDFSKLDLREVFEELMKNYKPGKINDISQKVGERLEIIKKGMVPGAKQQPHQRPDA